MYLIVFLSTYKLPNCDTLYMNNRVRRLRTIETNLVHQSPPPPATINEAVHDHEKLIQPHFNTGPVKRPAPGLPGFRRRRNGRDHRRRAQKNVGPAPIVSGPVQGINANQ